MVEPVCKHCGSVSLRYPALLDENAPISCGRCGQFLFRVAELRCLAETLDPPGRVRNFSRA